MAWEELQAEGFDVTDWESDRAGNIKSVEVLTPDGMMWVKGRTAKKYARNYEKLKKMGIKVTDWEKVLPLGF